MDIQIRSKKDLEVRLSKLKVFSDAQVKKEQYPTEPAIAAEVLWDAYYKGYVKDKVIVDLGCGTGILGLGALLLGAKKVFLIDVDKNALKIAKSNIEYLESEGFKVNKAVFIEKDIKDLNLEDMKLDKRADLLIENPPFGVKNKHADRLFLQKAFSLAYTIYTFHKSESGKFIISLSRDKGFRIEQRFDFKFPLKQTMKFHSKRIKYIDVSCWNLKMTGK